MSTTILITGSTDGIGLLMAKTLASIGHKVLLHGRSEQKLDTAAKDVGGNAETYAADLSHMDQVRAPAVSVRQQHN